MAIALHLEEERDFFGVGLGKPMKGIYVVFTYSSV